MPKIPTNPHPLHQVRKALGWTQQKLADKCGVAVVTIKKIEGGALNPGVDLLGRIMWVTGVDPESILGSVATSNGQPYTAENGQAHLRLVNTKKPTGEVEVRDADMKRVQEWADVFGELMATACKKNALYVVGFLFERWARDTIQDLQLEKDFSKCSSSGNPALERLQKSLKSRKKAKR